MNAKEPRAVRSFEIPQEFQDGKFASHVIRRAAKATGLTQKALAEKTGIEQQALSRFLAKGKDLRVSRAEQLWKALGLRLVGEIAAKESEVTETRGRPLNVAPESLRGKGLVPTLRRALVNDSRTFDELSQACGVSSSALANFATGRVTDPKLTLIERVADLYGLTLQPK